MKKCHLLLGRPWLYDRRPIYDGSKHTYSFKVKGKKIILALLNHVLDPKSFKGEGETLISHGECQQDLKEDQDAFALVEENKVDNVPLPIMQSVSEWFDREEIDEALDDY